MIAPDTDPIGIDTVQTLADAGFDYVELSISDIVAQPARMIEHLRRRLDEAGLACEAFNNFFPAALRLTGPDADRAAAMVHAEAAMDAAAALDGRIIVFGSGPAKMVPAGFPREQARAQLVDLLDGLGDAAGKRGLTIAIEPLNRLECNIVNTAAEGLDLMAAIDHPHVRLLVDSYHMLREDEGAEIIEVAGPAIAHVHVAAGLARRFPQRPDSQLSSIFTRLGAIGYRGRCSVEAFTDHLGEDATRAIDVLRALAGDRVPNPTYANT